jgi:gamma-glutamylcyclotransferase
MNDRFLHFAYGSNMLARRLTAADRAPSAKEMSIGYVPGHRFTFDKRSSMDGSGKGDMLKTDVATDLVYGVVFSIARADEASLDEKEGYRAGSKTGYGKATVTVITPDGPEDAIAYIARVTEPSVPFHWYKAFVVAGAVEHNLPAPYVEWLRTFPSLPDSDAARRSENEGLLFANGFFKPKARGRQRATKRQVILRNVRRKKT